MRGRGGLAERFVRMLTPIGARGWGRHYLPHDGDRRAPGAAALKTPRDMLEELGLRDIEIVPRTLDETVAIQQLRDDFGSYWFDQTACAEGLKHLSLFRKDWNERLGTWSDRPRRDQHKHAADALRQKAQGFRPPSRVFRRRHTNRSAMAV
jgi:hypothetical protein